MAAPGTVLSQSAAWRSRLLLPGAAAGIGPYPGARTADAAARRRRLCPRDSRRHMRRCAVGDHPQRPRGPFLDHRRPGRICGPELLARPTPRHSVRDATWLAADTGYGATGLPRHRIRLDARAAPVSG